jgi:cytochrome oxidase assembly protein ShyY1
VYRFLLSPRWIALILATLVAMAFFVGLGAWQWDRARTELPAPQVGLDDAVALADAIGEDRIVRAGEPPRAVRVTGRFDDTQQRVVVDPGLVPDTDVVTTPLLDSAGDAILVARGTVPSGSAAPPPSGGEVEVLGWLIAAEPLDPADLAGLTTTELPALSPVPLVSQVDYRLVNAVLQLAEQTPPADGVEPLPSPQTAPVVRTSWRSLGYAIQWWVVAAVAGFLTIRAIRTHAHRTPA